MRRIEEESARMKVLVEDLLLLARLDETRPVERAPVDLAVLAADACSDAVAADPGRPVTLDASGPVIVFGDEDHLRQAIANLVSNALSHTVAGTPIEVSAARTNGHASVVVRDHGEGLDARRARPRLRPVLAGRPGPGGIRLRARPVHRCRHRAGARWRHLGGQRGRGRGPLRADPAPALTAPSPDRVCVAILRRCGWLLLAGARSCLESGRGALGSALAGRTVRC